MSNMTVDKQPKRPIRQRMRARGAKWATGMASFAALFGLTGYIFPQALTHTQQSNAEKTTSKAATAPSTPPPAQPSSPSTSAEKGQYVIVQGPDGRFYLVRIPGDQSVSGWEDGSESGDWERGESEEHHHGSTSLPSTTPPSVEQPFSPSTPPVAGNPGFGVTGQPFPSPSTPMPHTGQS
ncbi:MAG: hypothetical protein IMW91_07385 [Firmicutes bacterium]|nr:hypothetical protein [Bacillota bacterium]